MSTEIPRRLVDEMPAKLNEIDRLAREWFTAHLQVNEFTFDANGRVVPDPRYPTGPLIGEPALTPEESARPMQEMWNELSSDLEMVRARIEPFYDLEPLDFTVLVGALGSTARVVDPEALAPTSVSGRIAYAYAEYVRHVDGMINEEQWTGQAADRFHHGFLEPFLTASLQQQVYAQSLAIVAQSYHGGVTTAHKYLLTIADTCIARLSGEGGAPAQATDVEVLSWTSMISGALSFFGPIAFIAGTISLSTSIGGYVRGKMAEPPGEAPISGTNPPDVLTSTLAVVNSVYKGLSDLDDELDRLLSADLSSSSGFQSPGLRLDRPDLAAGPGEMGTLTIDRYPERLNNDVVVSLVNLYRAGYVLLPGAAGQYDAARARLASCVLSGPAQSFFSRSARKFADARVLFDNILTSTGGSLSACGTALVACASQYQMTDEESAEYLRRIEGFTPPVAEQPVTPRQRFI